MLKPFLRKNTKKIVSSLLIVTLIIGTVQEADAKLIGWGETEWLGSQHAYGDVCQRFGTHTYYVFGVAVKEEMVFETFQC